MPEAFDEQRAWALNDRVALRPESFGPLAYHHGTRRLSFLKQPTLVRIVEALGERESAADACDAIGIAPEQRAAIHVALGTLASNGMTVERTAS